ncbi:MAG TPA: Pycsar system effector family protein [Chitinophagaceae bacterium]|nr:Pycsar system effector family protein [Chitinophagaceae bacterium]
MKEGKKKKIKTDIILKETASNYVRLIGDADRKARIMLLVNSLFLTLSVTLISKIIADIPYNWLFASILMFSNVISLFFSIQSIKPEFTSAKNDETENNILHYKKCNDLTLEEYRSQINSTLIDDTQKMDAFIKELYFYGRLLNMKYKLLKIAHYFFLWGIVLAVLIYIIILIMFNRQT